MSIKDVLKGKHCYCTKNNCDAKQVGCSWKDRHGNCLYYKGDKIVRCPFVRLKKSKEKEAE